MSIVIKILLACTGSFGWRITNLGLGYLTEHLLCPMVHERALQLLILDSHNNFMNRRKLILWSNWIFWDQFWKWKKKEKTSEKNVNFNFIVLFHTDTFLLFSFHLVSFSFLENQHAIRCIYFLLLNAFTFKICRMRMKVAGSTKYENKK